MHMSGPPLRYQPRGGGTRLTSSSSSRERRLALLKNFYSRNQLLLHRAITAAIGLQLQSVYRDCLCAQIPDRFNRLLRQLDNNQTR
jgi:Anti-sigma factor NepR